MNFKRLKRITLSIFLACYFAIGTAKCQLVAQPELSKTIWPASWIGVPGNSGSAYGIYIFRKKISLSSTVQHYPVLVSADNRYKLYVNEKLVSMGPAKSDISNWNYERIDLAPYLSGGDNIISAQIWNEGEFRPEFQLSFMTGFILQGATAQTQDINTNHTWKGAKIEGYLPISIASFGKDEKSIGLPGWYIAGPGEQIDMQYYPSGWKTYGYDDSKWDKAISISRGIPKNTIGLDNATSWRLIPSTLPQMEYIEQRFGSIRNAENITLPTNYPQFNTDIAVPKNRKVKLLIDQGYIVNAYPTIKFSGGKNSLICLTYAEALYKNGVKGNRNEIEGKKMVGRLDRITSSGARNQEFTTLAYRTYRFLEITIETQNESLIINDLFQSATGYPFKLNSKFQTQDSQLEKILEIGWRTARLCANETYMDCPYWEQMQYIGDTRIQALVSLYNSGDDRLVKNAITQIDNSRQPDGITFSRYPTINGQIIPTFSLWYIAMLHDYMNYGSDMAFLKNKLSGSRQILNYFQQFTLADGSIKDLPNWFFTDWVPQWTRGMAPIGKNGESAALDLQLLIAYQNAAELENNLGMKEFAQSYNKKATELASTIQKKYWDESKQLFSDTQDKVNFSQHTNALAILSGIVTGERAKRLGIKVLAEKNLAQTSIYFKYYLHLALTKAGLGDDYLKWLDVWRENISFGLSTWGEDYNVKNTRSDCHAWGASPNIEFYRTILGIESAGQQFLKIKIEPHLGTLKDISGEIPHPNGRIYVGYKIERNYLEAEVILPANTSGTFVWKKHIRNLISGKNSLKIKL